MPLQIINTESKGDDRYKSHIATIALADAEHDLGDVLTHHFKKNTNDPPRPVYNAFKNGLPQQIDYKHYSESYILSRTMGLNRSDTPRTLCDNDATCDKALMDWSTNVPNVTFKDRQPIEPLNIKVTQKASFNYNVVKFILQCSTNSKRDPAYTPYKGLNFGCDFFTNTGLGGKSGKAAFVVDFNQHGFFEKLKQGKCNNKDLEIIYLMTSEVANDPAPKPNIDNKSIFQYDTGIKISSWIQTGPEHIMFTTFDNKNSNPLNNFFSNYDFTMSPIKQTFVKKGSSLSVNLVASFNQDAGKPTLLATIEDSKKQNSIESVLGYIRNLINKIVNNKLSSASDDFNFNVKCQQKRGGDWFQVLACLDARNRDYVQILPSGDRIKKKVDPNWPIYFVTHDRIAVAYALMNGVNVVYLDYYGGVFVFKNTEDETTTSGDMGKMMFDSMKNNNKYYKKVLTVREAQPIVGLIDSAKNYQTARKTILDAKITEFTNKMAAITRTINTLKDDNLTNYFKSVQDDILRELFKAAVELMFVIMNLPDIQGAISFVEVNQDIFDSNYEESMKETVVNMSRSLNTINGIFDRFGVTNERITEPIARSFDKNISPWLNANLQLLNVYKIASKIEIDYTVENTSSVFSSFDKIKRMFSISQTKNDRTNETISYDKHTFLPFIKTLDNTYKKAILDNLTLLHKKNSEAAEKAQREAKGKLYTRHSKESTDQKKCNYIANLIYESLIIIDLNPINNDIVELNPDTVDIVLDKLNPDTANIVLETPAEDTRQAIKDNKNFVSISRDVDIMNEDTEEIKILKSNDGKVSNNTTELYDETVAVGGGTGFTEFGTGEVVKKNTVLDMNANQMTWPLFSYVLQDAYSLSSLENSLKSYKTYVTDTDDSNDDIVKELQEKMKQFYAQRNNRLNNIVKTAAVVGSTGYVASFIPPQWTLLIGGTIVVVRATYELYNRGYIPTLSTSDKNVKEDLVEGDEAELDDTISQANIEPESETVENTEMMQSTNMDPHKCQTICKNGKQCKRLIGKCPAHRGGAGDDEMVVEEEVTTDLLKDFDLCYHPLMPIYMLLSPFYYTLGPKYEGNSFFYTYFTYVNVLEKIVDVLDEKYLNDPTNNVNVIAGYLIGLTLSAFLFSAGTNIVINDKILNVVGMSQEDYGTFSLKNDSFASLITGSIHLVPEDEMLFFALLDSDLFKNFINVEVNIKQILEEGTSVDNLPSYIDLQNRITGLMNRIVKKVNVDRLGTQEGIEDIAAGIKIPDEVMNVDDIAAGIKIPDDAENVEKLDMEVGPPSEEIENMDVEPNSLSRQDNYKQIRIEQKRKEEEKREKALEEFKEWSKNTTMRSGLGSIETNQFNASARGIKGFGGKRMTKNRCKRKVCTRKKNVKNIKTSKKTRKHKRVHKRTRKNLN